jgi:hypothetical protein
MASYQVSGAGDSAANGVYVESGTANGKPQYIFGSFTLYWGGFSWIITDFELAPEYNYSNIDTGSTPPSTGWTTGSVGTPPAPTVSLVGGAVSAAKWYYRNVANRGR